ncbi:GIY-YIG nuclease family protein [Salinicoccus halodurans]|uniref:Endonuclease n=1 Tax=Salinicoccus halodurans TaxID=407035 RepID=A0A0F7HNE2_9STAP|nr:GIY-YIG nuclease family protein [Salinicoccus halodurans]AKG75162.1 methyltransferase [Salinicoccus halodurans]SFK66667.1 putative endonuclease [Salinicoccus halodurans]
MAEYYTYIVECADQTLYTGYAADLEKRIETHNSGTGAKYTRNRLPVALRYYEKFETKSEAMKREHAIKKLTRTAKMALIESGG